MRHPGHDFWRYSLRKYREAGVESACLALQDQCGADVNLLLWCGWMAGRGIRLDKRRLRQAIARVHTWQAQVVVPLRQARRALRRLAPDVGLAGEDTREIYQRILGLELDLEYIEQTLLADLAAAWPAPARVDSPAKLARASLARYLDCIGQAPGPDDEPHLALLVQAFGRHPGSR